MATGIGSLNIANLVNNWSTTTLTRLHHHALLEQHLPEPQ